MTPPPGCATLCRPLIHHPENRHENQNRHHRRRVAEYTQSADALVCSEPTEVLTRTSHEALAATGTHHLIAVNPLRCQG